jgi:CBS domain-containing protein/ribosome-associated translation inhibitor RaiA
LTKTLVELSETEVRTILHGAGGVFSPGDQVSKVLGYLKDTGRHEAVAAKGGRVGVISLRDLLGVDHPGRTKVESIWKQVGALSPGAVVIDAAAMLMDKGVRALPVVENGEVVGAVSQIDIIEALTEVSDLRNMAAKEHMQNPVITVEHGTGVAHARRMMLDKNISHIPVTREGRLVGMVTSDVIVHTFITPASKTTRGDVVGEKVTGFPGKVSDVMDPQPFTVGPDADMLRVVQGMSKSGKTACIMVDDEGVVHGIVTPRELLALIAGLRVEDEIPVYIVGITEEDFFERAVAEDKLRRIVAKNMRIHEGITEVSVRIKKQSTQGERARYRLNARVMGPNVSFNAEHEGWGLMETFDGLCDALDNTLRRAKKEPQKGARRGRRHSRPHLKP